MLTFTTLNAVGFCSIENLHLQLNTNCTVLIKATNGKGKSSILSSLVWALYGKNLKGVSNVNTWESVRPKDYLGTMVELYFQKDSHLFKIIRCQKYKGILEDGAKGNDRLIFLKDNELVNVKGKNQIQDEICKEVGLSYTLFMNSIMFGQGIKRLIQESNSDKKKIFEEVFDLEFLNLAKGIAQQEKKKQIKDEVDTSLQVKIKRQNHLILDLRGKIKDAKNLSNVPLKKVIKELVIQLESGHYKRALRDAKLIYKAFSDLDKYDKEYQEALERLEELSSVNDRYKKLKSDCEDIASDMASIDEDLAKLKQEKLKVMSPKYKQKLKEIRKKLRKVDEDFHNKELELENYNWLIDDPLGNNGIKAYLFDSSLERLNSTLDRYARVLGFRIEFTIDLGTARKDFVTLIERDGQIIDYDELSGGEKQICNIAMAFAMNEALTASKGINLAFLDEVFESLSSDNIEVVISLIRHTFSDKTLFLITHHDSLPLGNTKILQVEKVNGLSRYQLL